MNFSWWQWFLIVVTIYLVIALCGGLYMKSWKLGLFWLPLAIMLALGGGGAQ